MFDDLPNEMWEMKEAQGMMKYINEEKNTSISDLVVKTKYSRERVKKYLDILKKYGSIEVKETKSKTIILPITRKSVISRYSKPLKEFVNEMEEVMKWEDGEREIMLAYYIFLGELFLVQARCQSKVTPGMDIILEEVEKEWNDSLKKYDLKKKWNEDEFHNAYFSESFIQFGQSILKDFDSSQLQLISSLNKTFGIKV